MINLHTSLTVLIIGLVFSFNAVAENITKERHQSITNSINAEYRIAKNKCSLLIGSVEDACLTEARAAKTKAMANVKTVANTSKNGEIIKNKTCDTKAKVIDEDREEDEMESAVTEVKPIESDAISNRQDIFKDRVRIVALQ
jgi:hypothetical protein